MSESAVQTPERADCALAFTGIVQHAEVAMKPLGDGSFVPTLVVELDDVGAGHHRVVAHVTFARDRRDQAEEQLKQLRHGEPATVTSNLIDMRLLLPAASLSQPQPQEEGLSQ